MKFRYLVTFEVAAPEQATKSFHDQMCLMLEHRMRLLQPWATSFESVQPGHSPEFEDADGEYFHVGSDVPKSARNPLIRFLLFPAKGPQQIVVWALGWALIGFGVGKLLSL